MYIGNIVVYCIFTFFNCVQGGKEILNNFTCMFIYLSNLRLIFKINVGFMKKNNNTTTYTLQFWGKKSFMFYFCFLSRFFSIIFFYSFFRICCQLVILKINQELHKHRQSSVSERDRRQNWSYFKISLKRNLHKNNIFLFLMSVSFSSFFGLFSFICIIHMSRIDEWKCIIDWFIFYGF